MKSKVIPYDAWVLVADGQKALLLRNTGTAFKLALEVEQVIEAPDNPSARDQGTDRPGRAAVGSRRSALGQTDFHEREEEHFSVTVAERLEAICEEKKVHKLVVVAPPKALADLRHAMPVSVRKLILAEYDKDLIKLPVQEIEKHLAF